MTSPANQTPVAHHEWQKICGRETPAVVTPPNSAYQGMVSPLEWKRQTEAHRTLNKA